MNPVGKLSDFALASADAALTGGETFGAKRNG
jgi:hypothetical protein